MLKPLLKIRKTVYVFAVLIAGCGVAFFAHSRVGAKAQTLWKNESLSLFKSADSQPNETSRQLTPKADELQPSNSASEKLRAKDLNKFDELIAKAQDEDRIRVIVGLNVDFFPEGNFSKKERMSLAVENQRASIHAAQDNLLDNLRQFAVGGVKKFDFIPFVAMETDRAGLEFMKSSPDVTFIQEDELIEPTLAESTKLIGADASWTAGLGGSGWTIAIIDTGVDKSHPFLSGKVVSEACYSTTTATTTSFCPGGASSSTASGSGVNCSASINECDHGTHVAGIAAGKNTSTNVNGVAKDSSIIAIQASSYNIAKDKASFLDSDIIAGLQRVYALRGSYNIAAVNMSLGGGKYTSNCDAAQAAYKTAIDNLRSVGIATIIASGNESYTDGIAYPACVSTAISVGSVSDGGYDTPYAADTVSDFSNSASFLSLLAPGEVITSSLPGGGMGDKSGTSMAAPHVAGAWAVMKQSMGSGATVQQILDRLNNTGVSVTDSRNNVTKKRIRLDAAIYVGGNPSLSSYGANASGDGGNGSFNLNIAAGWGWNAISRTSWITTSSYGTGSGTIYYSVAPNDDIFTRVGTIVVAGQTFTVTQAPGSCTSTLTPSSANPTSAGGTFSFNVSRIYSCGAWSAISTASWITIVSGSDQGNGKVTYSVAANDSANPRTGTISVSGGATFTVTQDGVSCSTTLSPASATVNNFGGTNSFTVSRNAACPGWSAISTVSWITVTSGSTGNGSGLVTYSVAENTGTSQRVGAISVSGASSPFTVTQDPVSCNSYLSQSGTSIGSAGGGASFSVTRAAACPAWTAISTVSWITITSGGSGTNGNGTVNFSVAENTSQIPRTGTISVSGSSSPFTITQAALSCSYSITPTGSNSGSSGTNGYSNVTAPNGCNWTATSNANWISITSGSSGNGNGTANFSVAANGSSSSRTGTLTIAGQTFTVTQDGAIVCNYQVSAIYYIFNEFGGTTNVDVTVANGCPWTVTNNLGWISIDSGTSGNGSGRVVLSAPRNTVAAFRQGVLTIAGNDFSVGQAAASTVDLTGAVIYGTTPSQQPLYVPNVQMTISGGSVSPSMTDASGGYYFYNLTPKVNYTVTPSKTDSVSGITPFDAVLILRCAAAGPNCQLTANQRLAADTNNSNSITPFDAVLVLRYAAATNKQTAAAGQTGTWKFTPGAIDYLPLNGTVSGQNYAAILVGEVSGNWTP